jgi:hypothetical protein
VTVTHLSGFTVCNLATKQLFATFAVQLARLFPRRSSGKQTKLGGMLAIGTCALLVLFTLLLSSRRAQGASFRSRNDLQLSGYYHTLTPSTLGGPNPDAAIGNPLRGLVESPQYAEPPYNSQIPVAVEFYYFGMYHLSRIAYVLIGLPGDLEQMT